MLSSITVVAFVVAIAAALRSTWSPCGVSMLSTITPLAESSRGRHYRSTAGWFVLGGVAGGLGLGALAAIGAGVVSAISPRGWIVAALAALATLGAAALDSGLVLPHLPHHRRQVNELWLDRYRGWVYGLGFGGQIGFGLATFIMTAAVYLTVVLAALTGRPLVALAVGAAFGLVRGLAVLASARLTTPDALRAFHSRFEAWRRPTGRLIVVVECVVAVVIGVVAGPIAALVVLLGIAAGVLSSMGRPAAPRAAEAGRCSVSTDRDWTAGVR